LKRETIGNKRLGAVGQELRVGLVGAVQPLVASPL
jgi:hypothetical protein